MRTPMRVSSAASAPGRRGASAARAARGTPAPPPPARHRSRERHPHGRAPRPSRPAPMACPTKMAPALATPKAGMKETELSEMTAFIAASAAVPRPPTTTLMKKTKAEELEEPVEARGQPEAEHPTRTPLAPELQAGDPASRRKKAKKPRKATVVARALASAEPVTPRAGEPQVAVDEHPVAHHVQHHRGEVRHHARAGCAPARRSSWPSASMPTAAPPPKRRTERKLVICDASDSS